MAIIKPYPFPVNGQTSRFEQIINGTPCLVAAIPNIPLGKFIFPIKNERITAEFKVDLDIDGKFKSRVGRPIAPYIPSNDIKEIVRLAQVLNRPILIKGEPGSGKTQLSRAVAYEWYGDDYQQHYFEWFVKSTSKAVDGLYTFDHVERLRRAQLSNEDPDKKKNEKTEFRKFGPMAMAFLTSTEDSPSILLIDEIDKADIDFPNDLLLELDERRFKIPESETGETIEAIYPPVIFITSNDERELPEAFLRRCIFLYIKFPEDVQIRRIIEAHLPELVKSQNDFVSQIVAKTKAPKTKIPKDFVDLAISQFRRLKEEREKDPADNKRVSTSELLDWFAAFNFDWNHQTGSFAETKKIAEEYLEEQLNKQATQSNLESRSIGNNKFYYQTVLKSYAAVIKRQDSKTTDPSIPK